MRRPRNCFPRFRPVIVPPVSMKIVRKPPLAAGRVKNKMLRWHPSPSPDVSSYRLYWSKYGQVDYTSDYAELGKTTQAILPDDVPSFPLEAGDMELGVTAINDFGNESHMIKLRVYFDFTVPDAPLNLGVEDM